MIIVTGATGQLGHAIVEKLVKRVPAKEVGTSVRSPEKAAALAQLGVRVREGDFANPDSLAKAFEGATQVLIVSSNAATYGGDALTQHRAAIAAARSAGARRILYTSHMSASASSKFAPARDHAATEEMLRESGVAWTSLRNGFYAASGIVMMGDALQTGLFECPADGKVSWTTHADLAEAAATILADEGRYDGPTPPLTGSEALDFGALAQIASELLGRPVRRQLISEDELRVKTAARGAPPGVAEFAIGYYRASREGEFAAIDPALEGLLGRRPRSVQELMKEKIAR